MHFEKDREEFGINVKFLECGIQNEAISFQVLLMARKLIVIPCGHMFACMGINAKLPAQTTGIKYFFSKIIHSTDMRSTVQQCSTIKSCGWCYAYQCPNWIPQYHILAARSFTQTCGSSQGKISL